MGLSEEEKDAFTAALVHKNALSPCPRCGTEHFDVVNGLFVHVVQDQPNRINLAGQGLPCMALLCKNCGYLIQHAVGALDLSLTSAVLAEDYDVVIDGGSA